MLRFLDAFKDWAYEHIIRFGDYLLHDDGFLIGSRDVAQYIFIFTSILLVVVMLLARPKTLLDITLTAREFMLSFALSAGIIARWQGARLPQWFIVGELYLLSTIGVLLMWAILREYFWSYWDRRNLDSREE